MATLCETHRRYLADCPCGIGQMRCPDCNGTGADPREHPLVVLTAHPGPFNGGEQCPWCAGAGLIPESEHPEELT